LPSTVTLPRVTDDIGLESRSIRLPARVSWFDACAESLALAEEAAKAGALHNSSDARATARQLTFIEDPRLIEQRSRPFAGSGAPEYARSTRRGHTPQVTLERSGLRKSTAADTIH
jgi:hypothetical protein